MEALSDGEKAAVSSALATMSERDESADKLHERLARSADFDGTVDLDTLTRAWAETATIRYPGLGDDFMALDPVDGRVRLADFLAILRGELPAVVARMNADAQGLIAGLGPRGYLARLHIVSAAQLPKADGFFGKIDPYFKVTFDPADEPGMGAYFQTGANVFQTSHVSGNFDPSYNVAVVCDIPVRSAMHKGKQVTMKLELWDKDNLSADDYCGCVEVPGLDQGFSHAEPRGIAIVGAKVRRGTTPTLTFSFSPMALAVPLATDLVNTFQTMGRSYGNASSTHGRPAVAFDVNMPTGHSVHFQVVYDYTMQLYDVIAELPTESPLDGIELGVTPPHAGYAVAYTMGRGSVKVKLQNVPMSVPFEKVFVHVVERAEEGRPKLMSEITSGHGWAGALNYPQAKAKLRDVVCVDSTQSIYFNERIEGGSGPIPFLFENDWDEEDADMTLFALGPGTGRGGDVGLYCSLEIFIESSGPKHFQRRVYGEPLVLAQSNPPLLVHESVQSLDASFPVYHTRVKIQAINNRVVSAMQLSDIVSAEPMA
mmetsp:Transcript_15335/g.52006  ORF Transcript_15335/g.52006 Transcript_15335/m.52006 type:complete len:541 (-) Transcript_15335:203-1825(-)